MAVHPGHLRHSRTFGPKSDNQRMNRQTLCLESLSLAFVYGQGATGRYLLWEAMEDDDVENLVFSSSRFAAVCVVVNDVFVFLCMDSCPLYELEWSPRVQRSLSI